ncbi:MAG TPA: hypothetical protein VG937_38275 [Polyangiaceae bacterium]|jgi:hypothetical protein|nr:hypothetical protein [Polyangiaceae bacterium]
MKSATRLLSALLATSAAEAAHAADPNASVQLEVRAAPDCTSQQDLSVRISNRLPRAQFLDDGAALGVRAQFATLPSGNVVVDVTLTKAGAKPSSRRLVARSCAQAADAAALIVAVTLDPTSLVDTTKADENVSPSRPSSPPGSQGGAATGAERKTAPVGREPRRDGDPFRAEAPLGASAEAGLAVPPSPTSAGSARFGAQISAQMLGGVAPTLMPAIAVYALAGLDRETPWSLAVVLGASHSFDASVEEKGGTATFWLDAASLDACALRFRVRSLEARACASTLVGRLSAKGTDTTDSAGVVRRPLVATGAAALMTLRVAPTLELMARATVGVNLIRDSFEFAPIVFHTVPNMTFGASVGIGIRSR